MNPPVSHLLIATRNNGKLREVISILQRLPFAFRSLTEFPDVKTVEESGPTLTSNAVRKAEGYANQTGLWSLADDSGLEVDALGGAPGVMSARFAGENATDGERVSLLLSKLRSIPEEKRTARFRCAIALADAKGQLVHSTHGSCEGRIILNPSGSSGFGYDPIFVPHGTNLTFAELELSMKNSMSHRARALDAMQKFLMAFMKQS
jgi:XTP/dITP diphosphohydrolase